MKTVIDIPVMDSEDILDYGLTISEGFMNTVYSPAEYESRSEVDRCTTENMGTFTRLTCTFEDIVSFEQDVVEHLYFKFNKEQVNMQEFGNAKIIMLNKFGYDGMEDPEKREQMVYYERYEMLKEGIDIPMDMASKMKVKLIPTQYQNNIRDFHYTENKQHLVSLRPNVSEDEEEEDEQIHFEFEFDVDKKVMRYESRSLLVTVTQAMSLLTGMIFVGFLYIDLLKKWKLGEW